VAAANGLPLDPAIATIVVLYILKIGLNIFCEYTDSSIKPPADDPESRRLPHD
jgi:divalent metal cation (Fe/Co/Zn/Cd) transporter